MQRGEKLRNKKNRPKNTSYGWLIRESKAARQWITLSLTLSIFSGCLIILQAGIIATIIDQTYLHQATLIESKSLLLYLTFIILLRALITYTREQTGFKSANHIKKKIRYQLFNLLLEETPDHVAKLKTGALTTRLIENVEALHNFYADYLPQMTVVVILPLIILIIVFLQNYIAGLLLLITAPLIPLFMALIGMGAATLNQRHFQSLARLSAHFLDLLQGLNTLTFFNRAESQVTSVKNQSEAYREKTMKVLRVAFLSSAVLELFSTVSIALIAVYLGLGLLGLIHIGFGAHLITLKSAFFILLLAPEFFIPLRQLGTFYHARAEAIAAATELQKIKVTTCNQQTKQHPLKQTENLSIQLSQVNFQYENQIDILRNFSLTIPAGKTVAITGPSGCGKSTLLKLIAKLHTPSAGEIIVNDQLLADIDSESWQSHVSLLVQNPYLFHATIANNIALGNKNASPSDIRLASEAADVLSFSNNLPYGLDTLIGEQHLGLSGGQAQRVALARAYLKDAPLVLLDEPTAHMDHNNQASIHKAITQWHKKKTVVIATHDKTLIDLADKVVILG